MCKELTELYDKMTPEHQEALMAIAKSMTDVERFTKKLGELTTK